METNASYSYTACAGVLQDCMQAAAAPSITGLKQEGSIHWSTYQICSLHGKRTHAKQGDLSWQQHVPFCEDSHLTSKWEDSEWCECTLCAKQLSKHGDRTTCLPDGSLAPGCRVAWSDPCVREHPQTANAWAVGANGRCRGEREGQNADILVAASGHGAGSSRGAKRGCFHGISSLLASHASPRQAAGAKCTKACHPACTPAGPAFQPWLWTRRWVLMPGSLIVSEHQAIN